MARKNVSLVDISGTRGYKWEWLSPKMQKLIQDGEAAPADASFDSQVATDSWTYGKLLRYCVRKAAIYRLLPNEGHAH